MRTRFIPLAVAAALLGSSPSAAQSPDLLSRILSAAELPVSTAQARIEGTPSDVISAVLDVLIGAKVPAGEAHDVIDEERAARRESGPVDNFGAFVQSQLAAGVRGRDLAAAIRAEHTARGKGPKDGSRAGNDANAAPAGRGKGRGGPETSAAGRARGGPPAAHPSRDSGTARGAGASGHGPAGKGKPANHPQHQDR